MVAKLPPRVHNALPLHKHGAERTGHVAGCVLAPAIPEEPQKVLVKLGHRPDSNQRLRSKESKQDRRVQLDTIDPLDNPCSAGHAIPQQVIPRFGEQRWAHAVRLVRRRTIGSKGALLAGSTIITGASRCHTPRAASIPRAPLTVCRIAVDGVYEPIAD